VPSSGCTSHTVWSIPTEQPSNVLLKYVGAVSFVAIAVLTFCYLVVGVSGSGKFMWLAYLGPVAIILLPWRNYIDDQQAERLITGTIRAFGVLSGPMATGILLATGYLLFLLKIRLLIFYAYAEIAFAILSCQLAVERMKEDLTIGNTSVLAASAYLVVRGLDNRKKALEQQTERAVSKAVGT
jgi:hypothetical protein